MNELYNRYALALLDLAKEENKVEQYRQEVASLRLVLKDNPDFSKLLASVTVSKEEKESVIDDCLKNNYSEIIINFFKVIVKNGRANFLYKIFNETLLRFEDELNIERGVVYSTIALSQEQIDKISDVIEKNCNKHVSLINKIDPGLIGGIKVVLRNDIYDASLKTKIESLKEALLKGGN